MANKIPAYSIIGHRGAPLLVPPGNTKESLCKAIEVGAQMLEVDIRRTRDDILVVEHEAFRMVAGQQVSIGAMSYAQWQGYTAETAAPMASLIDAFSIAGQWRVGLMMECKEPGIEAPLARAIRASNLPLETLLVTGVNESSRRTLRGLDPRIPLAHSIDAANPIKIDAKLLSEIDTEAVLWPPRLLNAAIVKVLQIRGIRVYAGLVDLLEEMRKMRELGVDGIMTSCPDMLASL